MYSKALQHLIVEVQRLKEKYLNFSNDEVVSVEEENQEKIRIFQILFHAELECYFEDLSLSRLNAIEADWKTNNWTNPAFQSFLVYSSAGFTGNPNQAKPEDRINHLLSQFRIKINGNHGIKEEDILGLLLPVGVPEAIIPPTLLPNLNSFGGARGHMAHKSKLTISVKPVKKIVVKTVAQILWDIRILEQRIRKQDGAPVPII